MKTIDWEEEEEVGKTTVAAAAAIYPYNGSISGMKLATVRASTITARKL